MRVDVEAPRKRFETARARCALRGIVLHRIEGDDGREVLIATQAAFTRHFADLTEVERWLMLVDGERSELAA